MLERLTSLVGAAVIIGIAYAACPRDKRARINRKGLLWGIALLWGFAIIVLLTPARVVFAWANSAVTRMLEFSGAGAEFVFGPLGNAKGSMGFVFAFQILPTIVFFAAFMAILYYLQVMPFIIRQLGRVMARLLGTSGAESFCVAADIFVGQTEAPLVVRPYISKMTVSELSTCMTAGFATTSGGVLAAYVAMLNPYVPDVGGHLIACSVMCAPAAIIIGKLMLPEAEIPATLGNTRIQMTQSGSNFLDAVAGGTSDGLRLAVNVGAMLIAFLALIAVVNFVLQWLGGLAGLDLRLETLFGYVFSPLAFIIGVPIEDVTKVGSLLGQKTVLNEFVAYANMSKELAADPNWLTPRGRLLAAYALCGFANVASIGIQIGGYSSLASDRRSDFARLALRAMLGGLLATSLVACVAGVLL
jgi:CNT family concentrative nucleoside transporter